MNESDTMNFTCINPQSATDATPRLYVASLADYNAGILHGVWIDACQPIEAIWKQVSEMLAESAQSVAEEWAIHDYENFGGLRLSEFEDLEKVADVARLIAEHGPVFAELVGYLGGVTNLEEARRHMDEGYRGAFDSLADYAQELLEDCFAPVLKGLPDIISYHIDYEGIGRDMELGGDVFTLVCEGKVHVFDAQL